MIAADRARRLLVAGAALFSSLGAASSVLPVRSVGASVGAWRVTTIQVAGQHGVPADASAAVLQLTVLRAIAAGYATVYPCGQAVPTASNLNFLPGETRSNAALSRLGAGGTICVFTSTRVELVVDLNGWVGAGGMSLVTPARKLDTRNGTGGAYRMAANTEIPVRITGGAVPAAATAATLNVTAVNGSSNGALTVYPCGEARPNVTSVQFTPGRVVPNLVVGRLSTAGTICVFTSAAVDVLVDVNGWMGVGSGYSAPAPTQPVNTAANVGGGRIPAGGTVTVETGAEAGASSAVVLNLTATSSAAAGYLTVFPCGSTRPLSSNANVIPGTTRSSGVVARPGQGGDVCIYSSVATDLVVDLHGWFSASSRVNASTPVRLFDSRLLFPTAASAGVPAGTTLRAWPWALRTSAATNAPIEFVAGSACQVFDSYLVSMSGNQTLNVDTPCVIFRRSRFVTTGDAWSLVMGVRGSSFLEVSQSDFDGGPNHIRGIQSDYASMVINESEFTRFGNAAVEMNDRSGTATMTVQDCYMYEPKGWQRSAHADGVQMAAGGGAYIYNNTILIEPFGGTDGDYGYVSNSAVGIGTSLGNIGTVVVDHNRLAGGGRLIYVQDKAYSFTGSVTISNNSFDRRWTPTAALWGPIFPRDFPPVLNWSGNTWDNTVPVSFQQALLASP